MLELQRTGKGIGMLGGGFSTERIDTSMQFGVDRSDNWNADTKWSRHNKNIVQGHNRAAVPPRVYIQPDHAPPPL